MTLERTVIIECIRTIAEGLVGPCADWQIIKVARHAGIVREEHVLTLEKLNDYDLSMLSQYMTEEGKKGHKW